MKRMTYLLIALLVIILLTGIWLAVLSHNGKAPGIQNGKLTPCVLITNCVCSEYAENASHVDALSFGEKSHTAWRKAVKAVLATGGEIVMQDDDYLAATYTSRFFRFVDDLELRFDPKAGEIHIRSSSRVGYSDFGVNARRVEQLREYFQSNSNNY